MSEQELNRAGARLFNLLRVILVRDLGKRNVRNVHDTLPEHLFRNPNPVTKSPPLDREKFENLKTLYYELRGWDPETGIPRDTTLHELGLIDVTERLKSLNLLP
jgi:aldehyde:ferredoxin oxidoreductase